MNKTKKKASQPSDGDKDVNGLMKEVHNLGLKEEPKPKSKNLDVLAEYENSKTKNTANFVVIGMFSLQCRRTEVIPSRPCGCW